MARMAKTSYRATVAYIRSTYGKRLRPSDFRAMMGMHSIAEVATYLKNTPAYSELLRGIEPNFVHRRYLENILRRGLFERDLNVCRLEQLHQTPFFRFFIMDYEVQELLTAIRLLPDDRNSVHKADYVTVMATWLAPYSSVSFEGLAKAKTLEDIIRAAAHTPYEIPLRTFFATQTKDSIDFTACEIALRTCYLETLHKEAARILHGSDLEALNRCIGEQIDLINLINAYRLKAVFHVNADTLRTMMLPLQGRLPRRMIQQLYDAPNATAFHAVLATTRYGRLLGTSTQEMDGVQMEHAFTALRCQTARDALHFSSHAAVSLYAVHILFQTEVQNLITLIESIRYGKSVSFIQSQLIL